MNQFDQYNIDGIPEGIYYGQNDRVDELNDRMAQRQFSDMPMKPNYDPRPVPTKYSLFPVIERVKEVKEPKKFYMDHSVEINFAPSTTRSHCNGYFKNVDNEHKLRNQHCIIQKYETSRPHIPTLSSELYNVTLPRYNELLLPKEHMHPLLFENYKFERKGRFSDSIGRDRFNNHTRQQLRNMQ